MCSHVPTGVASIPTGQAYNINVSSFCAFSQSPILRQILSPTMSSPAKKLAFWRIYFEGTLLDGIVFSMRHAWNALAKFAQTGNGMA